jgi:hypothetical protein
MNDLLAAYVAALRQNREADRRMARAERVFDRLLKNGVDADRAFTLAGVGLADERAIRAQGKMERARRLLESSAQSTTWLCADLPRAANRSEPHFHSEEAAYQRLESIVYDLRYRRKAAHLPGLVNMTTLPVKGEVLQWARKFRGLSEKEAGRTKGSTSAPVYFRKWPGRTVMSLSGRYRVISRQHIAF